MARLGADAQLYFDMGVGGCAEGRFVLTRRGNLTRGDGRTTMMPIAKPCYNVTSLGWILTAVRTSATISAPSCASTPTIRLQQALDDSCPAAMVTKGQGIA